VLVLGGEHRVVGVAQPLQRVDRWVPIGAIIIETRLPPVPCCASVRTDTGTAR
jgi:hypothetical protein